MRESSPACIAKPALPRENRTRGAHDSQTLGSNRAANGNASPAKAPSFSRSNNCKNSITFDGEGYSVSAAEAKGDGAAVDVHFFRIEFELTRHGDGSDGKSFIDLD